jgi:integrase
MLGAALRPEEAYALSVDALKGDLLSVTRSVRRTLTPNTTGKGPRNFTGWKITDEMKTQASRRTIELPADVVEVLQAHLEREAPRIKAAKTKKETPLMFAKPDNGIIDARPTNRLLKELCESLDIVATHDDGIDRLPTVAELRHSAITHMADHPDANIENVAGVSGHANERMVRDRYFHRDQEPPKTAAARLDWRK